MNNSAINHLIATVTGAFIAKLIDVYMTERNRRRNAKDEFLRELSELYGESLTAHSAFTFYMETRSRFQKAVFRVRPFLRAQEAKDLQALWQKFDTISLAKLDPKEEAEWIADLYKSLGEEAKTPPTPSRLISLYIEKFSKMVS